jgi:outer membrane protein
MRGSRFSRIALLLACFGPAAGVAGGETVPGKGLGLLDVVRLTLQRDPNVAIEEARLQGSRGALQSESGKFDPVVTDDLTQAESKIPLSVSSGPNSTQDLRTLQNLLDVTTQFRSGLSIEPQLQLLRTRDSTVGPGTANQSTFSFLVRQPLLRGRGRAAVAAGERSAERQVAASALDVRQTVSARVMTVASQYWMVEATLRNLDILRASEASSRDLLENTRKLIAADQMPAAEQVQLEANLAAKESARIGGERLLFQARQDLGREIGLDTAEIGNLPLPSDPLPAVRPDEVPPPSAAGRFVAAALQRRPDLQAARERQASVEALRVAVENALKPQLDLLLTPGYSGLAEGTAPGSYFSPLYRNVPGASASIGFSLSWPTFNNRARGDLVQIDATRRQNELAVDLLVKSIGANVPAALDGVARNALQLDKAREAVRLFARAVVNEEKKLRAGTSTLIDVISQRDRLTAAQQSEVSAQLDLANSILELRFETGTLVGEGDEESAVRYSRLTTVPVEEARWQ